VDRKTPVYDDACRNAFGVKVACLMSPHLNICCTSSEKPYNTENIE